MIVSYSHKVIANSIYKGQSYGQSPRISETDLCYYLHFYKTNFDKRYEFYKIPVLITYGTNFKINALLIMNLHSDLVSTNLVVY